MIDPKTPEIELDYSTVVRISPKALVRRPHKPRGGWGVVIPIKGQQQSIDGMNPNEVFGKARNLIRLNGMRVNENNLWFNLNIQWLQKCLPKYREVPLDELLDGASGNELVNEDPHAIQKDTSWIPGYAEGIRTYLKSENYNWETFLGLLKQFQKLLDPVENPLLGSSSVYIAFTSQLERVKNSPIYGREEAEIWFKSLKL